MRRVLLELVVSAVGDATQQLACILIADLPVLNDIEQRLQSRRRKPAPLLETRKVGQVLGRSSASQDRRGLRLAVWT